MKAIPQSAALYRAAVCDLNSTLKDPTERAEARALIAELLGRQVRIRQDGEAVFACLEIDEAVLLTSAEKSFKSNDFQFGSGGGYQFRPPTRAILCARMRSVHASLFTAIRRHSLSNASLSHIPCWRILAIAVRKETGFPCCLA